VPRAHTIPEFAYDPRRKGNPRPMIEWAPVIMVRGFPFRRGSYANSGIGCARGTSDGGGRERPCAARQIRLRQFVVTTNTLNSALVWTFGGLFVVSSPTMGATAVKLVGSDTVWPSYVPRATAGPVGFCASRTV